MKLFVILIICKHAHDSTMYSLINGLQCDVQGFIDIKHCFVIIKKSYRSISGNLSLNTDKLVNL